MSVNVKKILRIIKIAVLIYCAAGIALFYLQDKFLFHPKSLTKDHLFNFDQRFEEIRVPFNDTDTMSLVKFLPAIGNRKGIVVYYHGNMENVEHYADFAKPFTSSGYEVWMEDYPGFGKSTGKITEEKLYAQAEEVKKMADAAFNPGNIIIYGKSLGTGIAAYVASHTNAKLLVLETPYYSIPALFNSYAFIFPAERMSTYKIPTYSFLKNVNYPVVIFHGTDDGVIPYRCAKKLAGVLKPTDKFITVPGADHRNINASKIYYTAIDSLLK